MVMSRLSRREVQDYVEDTLGLARKEQKEKVFGYKANSNESFYVKSKREAYPVAVHPRWTGALRGGAVLGVDARVKPNFGSGYTSFPKARSPNGLQQHVACDVYVQDGAALRRLLTFIGVLPEPVSQRDSVDDIAEAVTKGEFAGLADTEREALVKARVGQGRFRSDLETAWGSSCAVTGISVGLLLRASHIKPWRHSDNRERLDADNGLLLVATLDAAFDAGLISFADDGEMLFSSELGSAPEDILGIASGAKLRVLPSSAQQAQLRYHRERLILGRIAKLCDEAQ